MTTLLLEPGKLYVTYERPETGILDYLTPWSLELVKGPGLDSPSFRFGPRVNILVPKRGAYVIFLEEKVVPPAFQETKGPRDKLVYYLFLYKDKKVIFCTNSSRIGLFFKRVSNR